MSHPCWILGLRWRRGRHGSWRDGEMSAEPINYSPGRVLVAAGVVYVRELAEHDSEVVRIVAASDDPVVATSQCLRIGARALRAANVTVDVDVIERSFQER